MRCKFYGKLWFLVSNWLGFSTVTHDHLRDHIVKFGGLGGSSKHVRMAFQHKEEQLQLLK